MAFERYLGDAYFNDAEIQAWCRALAEARPGWVRLTELGPTREGRPILLLTLGKNDGQQDARPGFWLDGGTHAAEWTGVMAALYAVSQWIQRIDEGDASFIRWLTQHTITVMPNVSPDGYEAMIRGEPYLRSTLRPPQDGTARAGLDPSDLDGDGATRWMRWRHPAGPFVQDEEVPLFMRPRRLTDSPQDAFFMSFEGSLINWDGVRWTSAPARYGLDLNRNFPAHWAPFSMFGQDGGRYPLSEIESRVMIDAFAARPMLSAGLTNHTYTGALLTQPYRQDSPMKDGDVLLMETLAKEACEGTGYRVIRVCPDFMYDPKKAIVGVWADTMSSVFGVPGYTLELWNPYGHCGVEVPRPAEFFANPDPAVLRAMVRHFSAQPGATSPWRPFDHPQLGPVELGGIDYMRTIRNPPLAALPAECHRGFLVADRLRLALPQVQAQLVIQGDGPGPRLVQLQLENFGCLSSAGLGRAEEVGAAPPVSAQLHWGPGLRLVHGAAEQAHAHIDGWGGARGFGAAHPIYPSLPTRGHRAGFVWCVEGQGTITVRWRGGRGGQGAIDAQIS